MLFLASDASRYVTGTEVVIDAAHAPARLAVRDFAELLHDEVDIRSVGEVGADVAPPDDAVLVKNIGRGIGEAALRRARVRRSG